MSLKDRYKLVGHKRSPYFLDIRRKKYLEPAERKWRDIMGQYLTAETKAPFLCPLLCVLYGLKND